MKIIKMMRKTIDYIHLSDDSHESSASARVTTSGRQHRTSKKLLTHRQKILVFVLFTILLTQQKNRHLHFGIKSQKIKQNLTYNV